MQRRPRDLDPEELRKWRADAGITQNAAAEWFDVSLRTYQGWEAGRRKKQAGPIRKLMGRRGVRERA